MSTSTTLALPPAGLEVGSPSGGRVIPGYEPLIGSTIRGRTALGLGALLADLPLFASWIAWGDLPASVPRPNVSPILFMTCVIGIFGLPGLYLLVLGIVDVRRDARLAGIRGRRDVEPWEGDHEWRLDGTRDLALRQAGLGLVGWTLALGILVPLHGVFLGGRALDAWRILPLVVLGLFDLVLVVSFGTLFRRLGSRLIRGPARLRFHAFPFRLGERVSVSLEPHALFASETTLRCVLRCVEETCAARTVHGAGTSGPATEVRKVGIEHARLEQVVSAVALRAGAPVPLDFALPERPELRTRLAAIPSWHWELLIESGDGEPGRSLARFLVPVY